MFAVVFEVCPRPDRWDAYLGHAASLRPELINIDGFLANERFASRTRPGWLVSLSMWRDEKALIRWRTHALHHDIQGRGRSTVFADYHLRVGEVVLDTASTAPLPQQRFDATESGLAKVLSLTEQPAAAPAAEHREGLLDSDVFDSLTTQGHSLHLHAWRAIAHAEAAVAGQSGTHRIVRVIRDYSLHNRHEAPQYFPPLSGS
jgi:heme-degrading monooxygenase HmoA